ncbi:MAG: hypothetical protein ACK4UJ_00890, partial [Leptonema sp. (in: bacteria)]
MHREKKQSLKIAYTILDFIISYLSLILATLLHFYVLEPEKRKFFVSPIEIFSKNEFFSIIVAYSFLGVVFALGQIIVFIATDLYQPKRILHPIREFLYIFRGVIINLVIVLAFLFFYREHSYSRLIIIYTIFLTSSSIFLGHILLKKYITFLTNKGKFTRNILILGTEKGTEKILEYLQKYKFLGYSLIGILKESNKKKINQNLKKFIIGEERNLKKIIDKIHIDILIVSLKGNYKKIYKIIKLCDLEGIDCRIIPDIFEMMTHKAKIEEME